MAKKGGKKGKPMVVSKTKRANHLKHKQSYKSGVSVNKNQQQTKGGRPDKQQSANGDKKSGKKPAQNGVKFGSSSIPSLGKKKAKATKSNGPANAQFIQDEFDADEMMDMLDDEEIDFFKNKAIKRNLSDDSGSDEEEEGEGKKKKRRRQQEDDDEIEEKYDEELLEQEGSKKKTRPLLPIKTKQGIVERSMEIEEASSDDDEESEEKEEEKAPLSAAEMYAQRKNKLNELKVLIGAASSSILENPEERMDNVSSILKLYDTLTPDVLITGFKLLSASLVELFKDLAPGFEIKETSKPGDRLKKTTREVYGNEARLLKYYQVFLKKLEAAFTPLKGSRKDSKNVNERDKRVGLFALKCMTDLLIAMPHFNFAKNIVHALIPFTAHKIDDVRLLVCSALKQLFREDKKGEISLHAVRQVNHMIKNKRHNHIPPDALDILIALRIKDVNLDREQEEEISRYKTLNRKQKLLIMSKNERRRKKKIERLEKEIVTAKAEKNKGSKVKFQTETVKLVFTIYFRILKLAPKSILMSVVLRGLAKFAHTINVEFFTDLVEVFNNLIANDQLNYRQCLHAIQVVLIMLSGQGEALNIDPLHFYAHLYKVIFQLTAGPSNADVPIALDCLDNMLIKRRKKVSIHRVLAFTKRIATLALHVQHNSSIGLLHLLRTLMMTHRQTDLLLDLDTAAGSGSFLPELEEPEHCNAGSTALWELQSLTKHYHPLVCKFAKHLLAKSPTTGNGTLPLDIARKSPADLYTQYDPSLVAFNPAVPGPSTAPINWKKMNNSDDFHSSELEAEVAKVLETDHLKLWDTQVKKAKKNTVP